MGGSSFSPSTMAIKTDGSLWGWGGNGHGQLGGGTTTARLTPVKIMDSAVSVAMGARHTMAVKTDGTLWAWGNNDYVFFDDDCYILEPVKIMDSVVSATISTNHNFSIKTDGSLWTDAFGSFVMVLDSVISVTANDRHSNVYAMAIKTDGSLWGWGDNGYGQLGLGTRGYVHTPVKIMDSVASLSTENSTIGLNRGIHTIAIKTDGSLWSWGSNMYGQIGDGTITMWSEMDINYEGEISPYITVNHDKHSPVQIMDGVKLPNGGTTDSLDSANS